MLTIEQDTEMEHIEPIASSSNASSSPAPREEVQSANDIPLVEREQNVRIADDQSSPAAKTLSFAPGRTIDVPSANNNASDSSQDMPPSSTATSADETVKDALPTMDPEEVDEALSEASNAFRTELSKDYLVPSFVSLPPDSTYEGRYFRYNLDCLMSELITILEERGNTEDVRKGQQGLFKGTQSSETHAKLKDQIKRFGAILKKFNDDKLISKIFVALFNEAPRCAWWVCSSPDWIGRIESSSLSTRHILDMSRVGSQNWTPPFLPIAAAYRIALDALTEAEDSNNYDIPASATSTHRIAKYLYLTILEAIRLAAGPKPGPSHEASIRQCEKKLKVIYTCLDESVGEGDDFLEVILSQMGNIGPDGQKLSVASIKRSLGGAFGTSHLGKIIGLIPTIMANANSPEAAKKALLESPLVKKMGALGEVDIDKFLGVFQSLGIMGHTTPTPSVSTATSSQSPMGDSATSAPRVRKSMAK